MKSSKIDKFIRSNFIMYVPRTRQTLDSIARAEPNLGKNGPDIRFGMFRVDDYMNRVLGDYYYHNFLGDVIVKDLDKATARASDTRSTFMIFDRLITDQKLDANKKISLIPGSVGWCGQHSLINGLLSPREDNMWWRY